MPVLVGATTRSAFGWAAAVVIAAAIAWLTRHGGTGVLITGFVFSSAFVTSGLVTEPTHYMPVAVTGGALALRVALDFRTHGLGPRPPLPILVTVGLYLAWAALATLTSIDRRTSAVYAVGMVAVCGLAFWVIPNTLAARQDRERFLASLGALGVVVALTVDFVSVAGGFKVFGRLVGFYQVVDLTLGGHATGLHFGYSSGAYLTPGEPSVLMAIGIIALLGWSAARSGSGLLLSWAGIVFMIPAVLLTLDRSAQLAAGVGAGAFVAMAAVGKLRIAQATFVFLFFTIVFLLVFADVVGANQLGPAGCTSNCSSAREGAGIRGGGSLSGREYLWTASWDAIKHKPILGYGPGNDVAAIDPYLSKLSVPKIYALGGLTSHSTWFRTAVEMGIPGLLFLLGTGLAVAWVFVRRAREARALPDATQIALAAAVIGLLPAMTFETFLLGGVTFGSLFLTVAAGLAIGPFKPQPAGA
ncbi:MAG TPA: O-antigen ligase family protein [Candidatus Dormibacteraeota bacterium]|nr:O-antigen ligase family protein [Candidatus Dormibacteraeota bacterium]